MLHTADWHLGRIFNGYSLLEEQAQLLDQILDLVLREAPDLFILAGDVFDRGNPRREAVELFDRFLERIYRESDTAIVVIAGNHDAPERIGFGGALHDPRRVLIRGGLTRLEEPLILEDNEGVVAVTAIPYAGVFAVRDRFHDPDIADPDAVVERQLLAARRGVPENAREIIVSHTFVAGGSGSDSERSLESAGGIEAVAADRYDGASYVALGHLHRPQELPLSSGILRYSGSIMPFGFDELDREKSVTLFDLRWWGVENLRTVALEQPRELKLLRGAFAELLAAEGEPEAFVKLELTDPAPIPDAMSRLRERYPRAVQLEWVAREQPVAGALLGARRESLREPGEVIRSFYREVGGLELSPEQEEIAKEALAEAEEERL